MIRLVILTIVLFLLYNLTAPNKLEQFCNCGRWQCPRCAFGRTECPTRNMSYDLRGEAWFPPRTNFPFDNSVIGPSNRGCYPRRSRQFWN